MLPIVVDIDGWLVDNLRGMGAVLYEFQFERAPVRRKKKIHSSAWDRRSWGELLGPDVRDPRT
jgi:hypothetical protein